MNIQFVSAWVKAITTSPEAALTFYADRFDFSDPPREKFIRNDKVALASAIRSFSNRDRGNGFGVHRLKVLDFIGDHHSGLVVWKWDTKHADTIFGVPAGGRSVQTTGSSFHLYSSGKITREIIYSDQIHVIRQLGYLPPRVKPASRPGLRTDK